LRINTVNQTNEMMSFQRTTLFL